MDRSPDDPWVPTRREGLRRLESFVSRAGPAYARLRNYDRGPGAHVDVSMLSPWLRHRLVLEEEVVVAVVARHGFSGASKFIQEVFWRTYWKGWLELRPSVWSDYRQRTVVLIDQLDQQGGLRRRWEAATTGATGIDGFDDWARELNQTGYLHNHARMWFASIWIFTLELPWELGADFFLRQLLDGDPACNTLSWRWVAGLQTRGKTYLARADNIARYTAGRFAPAGLASDARPLPGPPPPAPGEPPRSRRWDPALRTGLLVTEEDLHPDHLTHAAWPFSAVAVLQATQGRSPLGVSAAVRRFVDGAIYDALGRLPDQRARTAYGADRDSQPASIVDWARDHELDQIVTAYAPVGPTAERLATLRGLLEPLGITLLPVLRRWDQVAWPHATHGFFRFREQIPEIWRLVRAAASTAG